MFTARTLLPTPPRPPPTAIMWRTPGGGRALGGPIPLAAAAPGTDWPTEPGGREDGGSLEVMRAGAIYITSVLERTRLRPAMMTLRAALTFGLFAILGTKLTTCRS